MAQEAYIFDRLVIAIDDLSREVGTEVDRLTLQMSVKNPVGSPGSTRRPPGMEVWDSAGRVYEPINDDWAEAVEPDTELKARVVFEVAPDAEALELVMAPGMDEEVRAPFEA